MRRANHKTSCARLANSREGSSPPDLRRDFILDVFDEAGQKVASYKMSRCRKTLEFDPNFFLPHFHLGRAYLEKGMYPEAVAEFERARTLSGGYPAMIAGLGYAQARAGHAAEARRVLAELQQIAQHRYVPALYFAGVYVGLRDNREALAWLNKAYQERSDYLVYLKVEPMADSLRDDPQFQQLLRRIGLP